MTPEDFAIAASGESHGDGTFSVHMEAKGVTVDIKMPLPGAEGATEAAVAAQVIFGSIPQTVEAVLAALEKQAASVAGEDNK